MDIVQIVAVVLGVILIFLAISNLRSKSNHTTDHHEFPYERFSTREYLDTHSHREPTSNSSDDGVWRGRDMSHDSHSRAESPDRGDRGGRDTSSRSGHR